MRRHATCHPEKLVCARQMCLSCYKKWWLAEHPEQQQKKIAYRKAWRLRNLPLVNAYERARKKTPEQLLRYELRTKYDLSVERYEALVKLQGNKCAICGRAPNPRSRFRRLSVDHDHETGKIRGLLCMGCNSFLGRWESAKWQTTVTSYLSNPPANSV